MQINKFCLLRKALSAILLVALLALPNYSKAETPSYAEQQKFTFSLEKATFEALFDYIESHSEFIFMYRKGLLDGLGKLSLSVKAQTVEQVLDKAFAGTRIGYKINDRQIVILEKDAQNVKTSDNSAATNGKLSIKGVVVDTKEPPMPVYGAVAFIKGSTTGVTVDDQGFFSIEGKKGETIVFSCIGYKDVEYTISRSVANLSIALADDVNVLEQAVVTGMSSQQRKHIASSVGVVDASAFMDKPVTQLSQALQGGTTGILVSQGSGQPGSDNAAIKIRGVASVVGASPLVLVDGFEFDMNKLDPSTVESVTILKDAAAASIYGAKAGGGVILITTKRGTAGTIKVGYNGYAGLQEALYLPQIADSWDYMAYANQAAINTGSAPIYSQAEMEMSKDGSDPVNYPNTNWQDLLINKYTNITEHNVSVSGGNTTGRFALSAQYLSQQGIYKIRSNGFERFTIRANTSVNMTKDILMFVDTFIGRDVTITPQESFSQLYKMPRNVVSKYEPKDGANASVDYYGYYYGSTVNALANLERGALTTTTRDYVSINARPQWNIMPGLTLKGQAGYRLSTGMDKEDRDPYVFLNYFTGEEIISFNALKSITYTTRSSYWSVGANLDWVKEFGDNRINVLGGWSSEVNQKTGWDNISLVSYYAKAYYSYNDKYLLEAGIRADGSSLFASGHKWGYFPSVAGGWNIHNEDFLKGSRTLNELKLRASFGMLGNNNIAPYSYQTLISAGSGVETKTGNPDLKWETVMITDIGLDASLFNYSLDFTLDVFDKEVSDLILTAPTTTSSGLLSPTANIGKARVRGLEVGLSYNKEFNDDTQLSISGGYSYNASKWLTVPGGQMISGNTIYKEGFPLKSNYFYVADGLLSQEDLDNYVAIVGGYPDNGVLAQGPGDIKYKDMNGDGIISSDDRVAIGDQEPHSIYYANLTFRYKNFDLDAQLTGQGRSNGFYYGQYIQPLNSSYSGAVQKWQLNYWTPENPDAYFPKPQASGSANEYLSTHWMFNRAFARLKYVQIGYSFPKFAKRINASKVRVYLNVQNALTFAHQSVSDPETCVSNNGGAVVSKYPIFRTFTAGLNIAF